MISSKRIIITVAQVISATHGVLLGSNLVDNNYQIAFLHGMGILYMTCFVAFVSERFE